MDIVVDTNVLVAGLRSRNGASNALLHLRSKGSDDMKAFAASLCGHFELPKRIKSML